MTRNRQINRSQLIIQRLRIFILSDGTLKTLCNWELLPLRAPALNVGTLELLDKRLRSWERVYPRGFRQTFPTARPPRKMAPIIAASSPENPAAKLAPLGVSGQTTWASSAGAIWVIRGISLMP